MIKSVLLVKCGTGCICNSKVVLVFTSEWHTRHTNTGILNCISSHYQVLSAIQILPYKGLLLYIILMFYNFSKHNI
jgi:hypothetical protein